MSIYQEIILDHYKNPKNFGTLDSATHSGHMDNPLCGDNIQMTLIVKDGNVIDINFSGTGCAISLASASILTEKAKGKTVSELKNINKSFIVDELGIELSPNRLKCALLSLEVLQKTIESPKA
jgi:nitrogen fixation NifU-like protein